MFQIPTLKNLEQFMSQCQTWSRTRPASELLSSEDLAKIAKEVRGDKKTPASLDAIVRERASKSLESLYSNTMSAFIKRREFEDKIRRPYFHVKSIELQDIKNWHNYLDFEEANGTFKSCIALYERCIVTTALYCDFWIRYAKYVETHKEGGAEAAKWVLERGCRKYCRRNIPLIFYKADFEERHGNVDGARRDLEEARAISPTLLETILQQVRLERRYRNHDHAIQLYDEALDRAEFNSKPFVFLVLHYSRYTEVVLRDYERTVKIFELGRRKAPASSRIIGAFITFEQNRNETNMFEKVCRLFEDAIGPTSVLDSQERARFRVMYQDFVDDFKPGVALPTQDINNVNKIDFSEQPTLTQEIQVEVLEQTGEQEEQEEIKEEPDKKKKRKLTK